MAYTMLNQISVYLELYNGTDSNGNTKTVKVSLGNLSETNYNDNKVLAVVNALAPCLSKNVYAIKKVTVSSIYSS